MNYQTINAKELTQKAVEKHGSQINLSTFRALNINQLQGVNKVKVHPLFKSKPAYKLSRI